MKIKHESEPTFERCSHDRKNPYVMISREMAQDKSISPKAKGVLLYILSLPDDWKIYHSQLQEGLGIGEDYLNSAIEELINAGYAERTREKVKGMFQPYRYKIREFKKFPPDRENRTGSSGPENPDLYINNRDIKNPPPPPNPQALPPDVPDSDGGGGGSLSSKDQIPVYDFLDQLDIPNDDKQRLSGFEKGLVWRVMKFCQRPTFRPNKSLSHALFYYCKNPEKMDEPIPQEKPVSKQIDELEIIYANKEYTLEFLKQNWHNLNLRRAVSDRVNFVRIGNDELYYKDSKFKELFTHFIGKLTL